MAPPLVKSESQPNGNSSLKQPLLQSHHQNDEEASVSAQAPDYMGNSSWFGYLLFLFCSPLLKLGNQRVLTLRDLPPTPSDCDAEALVAAFLKIWKSQKKSGKQSIIMAMFRCLWRDVLFTGICALFKGIGVLSGPIFLFYFVDYANGNIRFEYEGVILVILMSILKIMENIAQRHWYFGSRVLGTKMQSIAMAAIYQKELCLTSQGRRRHTTGEIVNYISVDGYRLCEFAWRLHWMWLVFFIFIGSMIIAFTVVDIAVIPAVILIIAVIVGLSPLIRSMQFAQRKFMATQDERLRATSEVLQGMKVIKLQAWEEKFDAFIQKKRGVEFGFLSETQHKRNYTTIIYWVMPVVLTCVVLFTALMLGTTLTSTIVFTVLATFRIIQDPVRMTPEVLASFIQAQISLVRLEKFFVEEELPIEDAEGPDAVPQTTSEYVVRVDDATFSWNPEEPDMPTLSNINLVVKKGEKVAICGSVGAGKSSFLLALLGEIPKSSGSVQMFGNIAYVPQSAWIQTMTVRDNILFGKPYEKQRYRKTVRACALDDDMKSFSHGDQTEIGERGINMSGGQKQRIQIARAVYNDADVYLLDDPFSAVDAHTASYLFHECVMGALKDKTVILVTHQMEFLPAVDTILVMKEGRIKQAGTYYDLINAQDVFQELVNAHEDALQSVMDDEETIKVNESDNSDTQYETIQKRLSREESLSEMGQQGQQSTQLVQDEAVVKGGVGLQPYFNYIRIPRAHLLFFILILAQLLFSGSNLYSNLWLAQGVSNSAIASTLLIGVYCGISCLSIVAFALRCEMIVQVGLKASDSFFSKLMTSIMKSPMSFFDSTPSGRILNRASVDMSVIDLDIPFGLNAVLGNFLDIITIIIVTCIVTWEIIIVVVPVLIFAQYLQRYYAAAARELNRINSTTKAPIVNNSAETTLGAAVIRAFRQTERFRKRNIELINRDASAYIYKFAAIEWMVIRIEISCTVVLIVAASLVISNSSISGGFTGLAVTYALALGSSLVVFQIWQSFFAIYVVSVERIKQYLELPREAPAVIEDHRPPPEWPTNGEVHLDNLQIRYRENSPLVLKGITCTFQGGQKIGVVGRTGSGKTTLISALFRLVEPCSGRILIDNIDICTIGLHDLRFKLGIIPQEPVLFQGTVRINLDPLNQYSDEAVWAALRKCQLADVIEKLPLQLESPVSDQGENWSAGQRQLFCLGRVLLKQSKILVLDEATASIDSATDAFLQKIIREEFAFCTVITVAHRIPTVIDSDMVLALRDGMLMEFDSPKRLIDQKMSLFAQLVAEYWAQAGRATSS